MRKNRFTFNYFNMGLGRKSKGATISATSLPTLSQLYVGDTIASKYTAGSFTSTAGTISSTTTTYYQNGMAVPSNTVVVDGDEIRVANTVVDSAGNSRSFTTSTVVAIYTAPTVTVQPTITPSTDTPASVFVLDLGSATNATAAIDYFRFNDVSVVGDLSGLNYTSPTGVDGTMTLRVSYTNSGGTVYSEVVSAVSNAEPVISNTDLDELQTPAVLSFESNEDGVFYYATNGSATPLSGSAIQTLVEAATPAIYGQLIVNEGTNSVIVDLSSLASGTYYLHTTVKDDLQGYSTDTVYTITVSDAVAPILTSPTDVADGTTSMTGSVQTDEANGTLYFVVSTSSTAPTGVQVEAGQTHTGAAASASGSQAVTTTGIQNVSASGLTASTAYFTHYMHKDASGNRSSVVSADGFTTAAAGSAPTVVGAGTFVGGGSTPTIPPPDGLQVGDVVYLFASFRGNDINPTAPATAGFTEVVAPFAQSNTSSYRKLAVWYKRVDSLPFASVTMDDVGNHIAGVMVGVRGAISTGTPHTVLGTAFGQTAVSAPGGDTGGNNRLILSAAALAFLSATYNISGWANSDLTSLTERVAGVYNNLGGSQLGVVTGVKTTQATIGVTTGTLTTSCDWSAATISIIPE